MKLLPDILARLTSNHRQALQWFIDNQGKEVTWPAPLENGTRLATKAKGIYKPGWSEYALSIRQSMSGPYEDKEPVVRPDGTWTYFYYQENQNPDERDSEFTNRGLVACCQDSIPVGVMRQTHRVPRITYAVLGVALVAGWSAGYFILEGFSEAGKSYGSGSSAERDEMLSREQVLLDQTSNLQGMEEGRERILASIVRRRGQGYFRQELLSAYNGKCAISNCDAPDALEAAHIIPYSGPNSNHPSNGLLLRSDLHTLFDLGLIAVDTGSLKVLISPRLADTSYGEFAGVLLRCPVDRLRSPSKHALDQQRVLAGL